MTGTVGWTDQTQVNWDDVSTEPPPPLPVAIYKAVIAKAEPGQTKKGDKNVINLELAVDGEFGGDALSPARKMFDSLTLSPEAAFKIKQIAASANVQPPKNFGLDAVTEFCNALVDSSGVILRSKLDTYQGKTNHRVDRYFTEAQANEAKGAAAGGSSAPSGEAPARRKRAAAA
jgi:hypothetical protein